MEKRKYGEKQKRRLRHSNKNEHNNCKNQRKITKDSAKRTI